MTLAQKLEEERKFIETCVVLKLLDETDAKSLREVAGHEGRFVAQTAVQRGMLTPADVDIVYSLQKPTEIVPGYRILELVGRGGMGVVYRALQLDLERTVALKIILISNVSDPTAAARFEREAKALARLQHPNIVQALNFGRHEGRYYFSMEFVSGRTCEQAVRDSGILTPREVWSIVRQVASGLMHALRQQVIHRDIKPANLILVPPPEGSATDAVTVKIADFGLAMLADQNPEHLKLTTGDKVMGSPAYMSLEQFGGRPVDFRSDIYSLGATAWHLLFGRPPFGGRSVAALFQQKSEPFRFDPSDLPVVLPADQMGLLMGLLDPDPQQRPQSYEQLIDAIDALEIDDSELPQQRRTNPANKDSDQGVLGMQPTTIRSMPTGVATGNSVLPGPAARTRPPLTVDRMVHSGDELPDTIELSRSAVVPDAGKRGKIALVKWLVAVACVITLLAAVLFFSRGSNERGPRTRTRVIGNTPLFDGVTLSGWDVGGSMVGAWNTVEAPDASTAIACTTRLGALTRKIPETPHPRISLFVWLLADSGAVDVDFAFDPADPSDTRGCLRLTAERTTLGRKTGDFEELDEAVTTSPLPTLHDRFHVIHVERQVSDWYVFLEERFIGSIPIEQVGVGNAIRLVIHPGSPGQSEGSQAFFADVQLYELGATETQSP
jgi:serine/threonine-protein kinase